MITTFHLNVGIYLQFILNLISFNKISICDLYKFYKITHAVHHHNLFIVFWSVHGLLLFLQLKSFWGKNHEHKLLNKILCMW